MGTAKTFTPLAFARMLGVLLVLSTACTFSVFGQTETPTVAKVNPKNILLLYSYGHGSKGIGVLDEGLLGTLGAGGINTNNLFFEYLDLERHKADSAHRELLKGELLRRYAKHRIDLIITIQQPALDFLLKEGKELASGIPAITVQAPLPTERDAGNRRFIGLVANFDIKGTLERALEIFPDTRRVVFVSGSSEADQRMASAAAQVASAWNGKLEFEYTSQLSLDQMLKHVENIPPRSIIIFTQYNRDTTGKVTVAYEVEGMVAKAANAPVFGLYDFNLRNGGIGGSVVGVKDLGERTGRLALDLLNGTVQPSQPVSSLDVKVMPMFDWGQIKRWGGDPRRLRDDSILVNRVPTFWEQYRLYVIGLTVFLLAQTLLIAALLVSRRRRELAELSLKESEQNLAITLHSIGDAVIATDSAGHLTRMNATAERLSGWTLSEAMGRPLSEVFRIVNADAHEPVADPVQLVMAHGKVVGLANHTVLLARDGREYQIADSAAPIRNSAGAIVGVVLVFSDVTEKYQAEEALRQSEDKYRRLFEDAAIGVFRSNFEDRFIEVNPALAHMLGYDSPQEVIDSIRSIAEQVYENPPKREKNTTDALAKGGVVIAENRYRRKDGAIWIGNLILRSVMDANGQPQYFEGFVEDITERKQAEAERARLEVQLRESQKMDALGTLAGGVAHDFNNALAAIIGNVELARQDVGPAHAALESLEEIGKASRRARNLVQQILAFGRRQTTERKLISLAPIVQEAVKFLRSTIPAGVSLNVACTPEAPSVLADVTQIEQVLINLGSNAWHAIEGQERAGLIEIRLDAELRGGLRFAVLTVRDNGRGMDEATRSRIFEPFFTTKPADKGTGLGLSVVYGIAQAHEAGIEVRSTPGEGTAFVIRFAAAEPPAALVPATNGDAGGTDAGEPLALQSEGKRVLYVDDEASIVSLMTRLLGRRGYRVSGYIDPGEALAAVRADPAQFDLAVTDYNMPGMSGLAVASALREIRADLPVILISGYITEELQRDAPAAGVRELIFKADAVEEVCEAVARYANAQSSDEAIS